MIVLEFILHVILTATSPQARFTRDLCNYDGDRFVSLCAGLFQIPESWTCIEVPLR